MGTQENKPSKPKRQMKLRTFLEKKLLLAVVINLSPKLATWQASSLNPKFLLQQALAGVI